MIHQQLLLLCCLVVGPCLAMLDNRQAPSSTSSAFVIQTPSPAPTLNSSTYDLSQHFCRIYRHASVYADGMIYIDGGNTYVPKGSGTFYNTTANNWVKGMHNNLLVLDLSRNFTNQDTFPYKSLLKPSDVPSSLIEHTLWYSRATRTVYQLGGWFSSNNPNDPGYLNVSKIPEAAIWAFNTDQGTWSVLKDFNAVNTGSKIERPGAAANCDAPTLNMSFIFQGYVQQRSDHDYASYSPNTDFKFLEGVLALDTSAAGSKPTLTNISVPLRMDSKDFGPRMNGAMVHVPVGDMGALVQIGGQVTANPTDYGRRIPNANGMNTNIDLSFVDVYDIKSGYWFRQETFGSADGIPEGRSDICCVVVTAKDKSSFSIYMIAGVKTYNSYITTEEIWVLTLPTFQWVLVHTRADGMYGHTCHAVGENLVIIGGMQTQTTGGDVNTCANHMPAEIFSLVTQNYTGVFDAAGANRTAPVPDKVVSAIGGTRDGGAYVRSPKAWSDLYLQYVFDPTLPRPSSYPTPYVLANTTTGGNTTVSNGTTVDEPSSGPSKSTVIGASVGASVGALLIATTAIIYCIVRRKKNQREADAVAAHEANMQSAMSRHSELPGYSNETKIDADTGIAYREVYAVPVLQSEGPAELAPGGMYPSHHQYPVYGSDAPTSLNSEPTSGDLGQQYSVSGSMGTPPPQGYPAYGVGTDYNDGLYGPQNMGPTPFEQQQGQQGYGQRLQ